MKVQSWFRISGQVSWPVALMAAFLVLHGQLLTGQEGDPIPDEGSNPPPEEMPPPPEAPPPEEIPPAMPEEMPPPPEEPMSEAPVENPAYDAPSANSVAPANSTNAAANANEVPTVVVGAAAKGSDALPPGEELVNIDFPEPTEIKDIIKAVALWTGKNVLFDRNVQGKVQIISPRKVTKVEAYQAFLSALNMLDFTTVETGKMLKIIPVRKAVKGNLQTYYGKEWAPATDKVITQIVPLRYIDAKEVQSTLARILSNNAIIAYPPTNTLIISETGYKIKRILEIIELLDVKTQQPQVAIVPIKYADAKSVSNKINELYKAQTGGKPGFMSYKIIVEERSNSVIIFGPPRTIVDMKALVKMFDIQIDDPSRQASIHVRLLDYANAKKLATTLSTLAKSQRPGAQQSSFNPASRVGAGGDAAPTVAQLSEGMNITADESTNSLIITGSRSSYMALNNIIRKLDIRRSQVYVEADILDLNIDNNFQFGSSVFAGAGNSNGRGTKIATAWQAGSIGPLVVAAADTAASRAPTTAAQAASVFANDLTIGILSGAQIEIPGLGKFSPGALIRMIKNDINSKVIASPHLLTANNEEANITVGQKIFFAKTTVSPTTGVGTQDMQKEDIDLTLNITPNISHSNYVTMKINIESNSFIGQDATSGMPMVSKRNSKTMVTVKNNQTVVISGLEQTIDQQTFQKVPFLGDIPILGWLFRNSSLKKIKSNLTIFLTPHIVHGADDLASIYSRKIQERDEFFEAVYGSSFKESEFYDFIPKEEDGVYRPDEKDKKEDARQEEAIKELYHDSGLEKSGGLKFHDPKVDEEPLSMPSPSIGGGVSDSPVNNDGASSPDFSAPPIDPGAPPEAIEVPEYPEPPMPNDNPDGE
ncbi:MAG: type II secretion system secretin GspD [Oligoflexales bacterium]|nr:type II secretion system secretin GspD [Oligoflexales bacterium]